MTLAVVTDSSACLPRALADSRGIEVVALHLDKETGTTSRPSVTELARAYRRAAGRADEVLAVHLSACLSGTVDNARLAAEEVNEALAGGPVTVVDTGTCSGGVGLAALAPLPDVRQGGPTDAGGAGTPSSVDGVGLGPTGADGATAGPAGAGPVRAAELTALAVSPDHQRAGHGSRLLAAAVDLARADGAGVLLVWAVRGDESLTRLLAGAGLVPTGASRSLPVGRGVTEACWGASI